MLKKNVVASLLLLMASSVQAELLLFGGSGHDVFLGCVDCSPYSSNSICNEYGQYGSEYRDTIWNEYRTYGSQYRSTSPWNQYSSSKDAPVLVDEQGNFFGYFTINEYRSDAVDFSSAMKTIYENADGDLIVVRQLLCDALH